jgi:low temperature requirement protein LtrA
VTSVPANGDPAAGRPAQDGPAGADPEAAGSGADDEPLRVTTLELFFGLVFAFTLTREVAAG